MREEDAAGLFAAPGLLFQTCHSFTRRHLCEFTLCTAASAASDFYADEVLCVSEVPSHSLPTCDVTVSLIETEMRFGGLVSGWCSASAVCLARRCKKNRVCKKNRNLFLAALGINKEGREEGRTRRMKRECRLAIKVDRAEKISALAATSSSVAELAIQ